MTNQTNTSLKEVEHKTLFGDTVADILKFYYGEDILSTTPLPLRVATPKITPIEMAVEEDLHKQIQHIKQCLRKSYSLGVPTKDIDIVANIDDVFDLKTIEHRHKYILLTILDLFTVTDYSTASKTDEELGKSGPSTK